MGLIPGIKALEEQYGDKVMVPVDFAIDVKGKRKEIPVNKLPTEYSTMDIGAKTVESYTKIISAAKSIVVSGPMGVYENKEFNYGTKKVFEAIANSKAFSLQAEETPSQPSRIRLEQKNRLHQHCRWSTH